MTKEIQLVTLLDALEGELRNLGQWQETSPNDQALTSQEPFAIDTLAPQEWLQWIFIARMRGLLTTNQPIPVGFSMAPYFEENWKEQPSMTTLVNLIQQVDKVCSDA
ncbi:YqcC family protein [Vibrio sp. TBV020]|uniref:YqcC family protein n=1 Tax=Vibrio sp. TBV020 TaxID=3137398 RepID=UPI0038CD6D7E